MTGAGSEPEAPPWPPPRANPLLIGHDSAERELMNAWTSGAVAPAWLITGPPGIGKATLAFRFARFLLANGRGPGPAPADGFAVDEHNPVFRRIAAGSHGDLLTLERGFDKNGRRRTEIIVDDARAVRAFLANTAAEGGARIVVVDPADDLNPNSANAILKILEEPPDGAVFLLVCNAVTAIPATVRSRCRRLIVPPLETGVVADLVEHYRPGIGRAEAERLAAASGGSIGAALTVHGSSRTVLDNVLTDVLDRLPVLAPDRLIRLQAALDATDGAVALTLLRTRLGVWMAARLKAAMAGGGDPASVPAADPSRLNAWLQAWDRCQYRLDRTAAVAGDAKLVFMTSILDLADDF
jgi:DNA polymerase III subunit delta'